MSDKPSYHHGDLARAACEAAVAMVRGQGVDALSMREIASQVGVAHRALYRHYADREALLDAIAAAGFERLADRLAEAVEPRAAFVTAYVRFALEEPGLYELVMQRDRKRVAASPTLKAASDRVIALSLRALADGRRGAEGRDAVIAIWSMLHGAVALYRAGMIRAADAEQLAAYLVRLSDGPPFSAGK